MRTPQSSIGALAAAQHGLFTLTHAEAAQLPYGVLRHWIETGTVALVHPGVYRYTAASESWRGRLLAAVLAGGRDAVASHRSAGRLWQLRGVPRWRPEITVPGTRLPLLIDVVCHRTDRLQGLDQAVVDGVACTSVPRTLLDLGAVVERRIVRTAAQDAIVRRLTTVLDLVCVLERVGGRGRRGTAALRWTVRGCVPADGIESALEAALLGLVRSSAVPEPVVQHGLRCIDGRSVRFDLAWPDRRVAVEADGRRWHATAADFERDMARGNSVAASGWTLYRFGWTDVHERPATVTETLRRALLLPSAA